VTTEGRVTLGSRVRGQLNRVVVVAGLLVLLPAVCVVERLHRGSGRRLARWGASVGATACGVHFEVHGIPSPGAGSSIVVANHSSPMDIAVLLWADPAVQFMAAADLFRVPLLASAMRALDTVPIDRRDHDRAQRQLDDLINTRQGRDPGDVAVFAEGAIAPSGGRLPFKSGAFSLAIRTGSQVVPVAITGSDTVLRPRGRLLVRPGVVTIEFLPPVPTTGLTVDDRHALRDLVESAVLDALRVA